MSKSAIRYTRVAPTRRDLRTKINARELSRESARYGKAGVR